MIDTLALLLMLVSLLVGPSTAKELTIDVVNVKEGDVSTIVATRTKTGFEVRERKAGKLRNAVVYTRDAKKKHVYTVKLSPKEKPISLDATEMMARVKSGKIPLGRHTLVLRRSGALTYLMHGDKGQVWTIRATPTAEKSKSD